MTNSSPDKRDTHDEVETVRCIIQRPNGDILVLQKSPDSKAASLFEFPGGKIDAASQRESSLAEQRDAVIQEVLEETCIDLSSHLPRKVDEFSYSFEHKDRVYNRRAHVFHVIVSADASDVRIGSMLNAEGEPEDKHEWFRWVSMDELIVLKDSGQLSGNSQRFPTALDVSDSEDV